MRRTRITAAAVTLLSVAALVALMTFTRFYNGANAGVSVGTGSCSVGIEWKGDPGLFTDCTDTRPAPSPSVDQRSGDDNADGVIDEDETGWDCRTMGNRQCGPDTP
ncbi:hypothetical protein [Streptomyces sp. MBT27]|uniref:hypothetical protein n=1 Tax=Streptomyces sp. MBT27 TaxID=1488356 RepID=UPI00141DDA75|nr:hypothetical protein [Streptomyces sp. MBT27]